ncbi:reverse transcriptase domain-containing protein, partial [Tanacetum coccineum]
PTGGHHSASITRRKVYESGFYWPSIFKDAKDYVMKCDACQRSGNISSRSEIPRNNIQIPKSKTSSLNDNNSTIFESMPLRSYEHYKGVVAEVEHSKPGFELQGAKMVEMGRFGIIWSKGLLPYGFEKEEMLAMSPDNASSVVTYTSISSDSNRLSWDIPLVNAGELPEIDPYEEVAQKGQAHPLSPAYVPDPMELDEHVPVYVSEPEHPEYHAPSDDDIQVEDQPYADDASPTAESPRHIADLESMEEDTIDYPNESEDDDEDPKEDT